MNLLSLAVATAHCAARLVADAYNAPRTVTNKGAVDLVTETDVAAEALIRDALTSGSPYPVLGEEGGGASLDDGPVWVVDPIDGTTNFVHRLPHFAVSIGLHDPAKPQGPNIGVIVDVMRDEVFATDGETAWLGDRALPRLVAPPLDSALLATGFPYDRRTATDDNMREWHRFMKRCQGVRRCGAAALDLAWVAAGRLDGFWEPRLQPWDVAAGVQLVRAVGGSVLTYEGRPHELRSPTLVAAASPLVETMSALLSIRE